MLENTEERPRPGDFTDYREYLRAMIAFLKANSRRFSYRYFSERAGYSSPNFLKLVAEGKRNLSRESIDRFATALELSRDERAVFEMLVLFNQAKNDAERNRYLEKLHKLTTTSAATLMNKAQYDVYTMWWVLPIRELMLHDDFDEDPVWIARRLRPPVSPADVERALDLLERVGLAGRDAKGRLRATDASLTTAPTVPLAVRNYHRAMLEHAASTLDGVATDARNITSLTVSLSRERYDEICARIEKFRDELLAVADAPVSDEESREVHVLGFQVFPVSKPAEKS